MNWEETFWLGDGEERVNTLTHACGCAATVLAIAGFWIYRPPNHLATALGFLAYGTAMFTVYLCSTLSHGFREPTLRHRLRAWDQGAIYLLIAGGYTPFAVRFLPPTLCAGVVTAIWLGAAVGFYSKVFAEHRVAALATATYLLLGWLPAIPFVGRVPMACIAWMFAGGTVYTIGVIFLLMDRKVRYFHAVWHLCVMLASAIHFLGIILFTQ